jgi:hypothetical protein
VNSAENSDSTIQIFHPRGDGRPIESTADVDGVPFIFARERRAV